MKYIVIPSVKGQITIPPKIRSKYNISKATPIEIEDQKDGTLALKIMKLSDLISKEELQSMRIEKEWEKAIEEFDMETISKLIKFPPSSTPPR